MSEPVIVLNKLTKCYGKHRGIEEISFTVERGEIFGFIGPNGLRYKLKKLSSTSLR